VKKERRGNAPLFFAFVASAETLILRKIPFALKKK